MNTNLFQVNFDQDSVPDFSPGFRFGLGFGFPTRTQIRNTRKNWVSYPNQTGKPDFLKIWFALVTFSGVEVAE
jgi:hypothetical protein